MGSDTQLKYSGLVNITSLEPFADALDNGTIENRKIVNNRKAFDFTPLPDYCTV